MKNKIIILIIILVVILIAAGYFAYTFFKEKPNPKEVVSEIFSLQAIVSQIDIQNNFLMVKPMGKDDEIKVIISDSTKLTKLSAPFDPKNPPPPGTSFTPEEKEVALKDFKVGDQILVKSNQNIAGKTEFDDIEFIQILP